MKSISIKELHDKTGHWLRRVKAEGEVIVTERGNPVARMLPAVKPPAGNPFAKRKLLRGVARLIKRPPVSSQRDLSEYPLSAVDLPLIFPRRRRRWRSDPRSR